MRIGAKLYSLGQGKELFGAARAARRVAQGRIGDDDVVERMRETGGCRSRWASAMATVGLASRASLGIPMTP